ncbi:hypothetical protein HYU95_00390 [Candidatus Daviesbacteria bacterium]|nr:hypothetical protein [Candidatus Daviesbacteria bacterium]
MLEDNFLTLIIFLMAGTAAIYRISFFRKKTIGYFHLLQIIYLIIIPGIGLTLIFSYLASILKRPLISPPIMPDGLIFSFLIPAMFFTYGGIAIHSVTKMLWEYMKKDENDKAYRMNRFFHLTFSHNLIYSGGFLATLGLTLLELNRVPLENHTNQLFAIVRSIIMGTTLVIGVFWYNPYGRISRWSDLKTFFLVVWAGFLLLLYAIKKVSPDIQDYQLLLPALLASSLIAALNLFLVFKRLRRGGFRIYFRLGQLKRKLLEVV